MNEEENKLGVMKEARKEALCKWGGREGGRHEGDADTDSVCPSNFIGSLQPLPGVGWKYAFSNLAKN